MKIWPVCLPTLAAFAFSAGVLAQGGMVVSHQPPTCLSSLCGRSVLTATVAGDPAPQSVRVYFHAGDAGPDYFVEMALVDGTWEAVLPAALRETTAISYRIVASAGEGATASTDSFTVPATTDCKPASLTPAQAATAADMMIGLTEAGQTGSPSGFSCAGITKVMGADETLSPNGACEEIRLAKSDPCFDPEGAPIVANRGGAAGAGAAGGGSGLLGAAALGAAVVGGAVIIENNDDDDREPVSQSRP